jgi:hypothetical protein
MRFARVLTPLLFVVACTGEDDKAPGEWVPGKGDGAFELYEAGPATTDGATEISLDSRVPAYRIESFGGTKVKIDLKGHNRADAYLIVEGPLADHGDRGAIGSGTVVGEDDDSGYGTNAKLELTLERPGVYRILTGTSPALSQGLAATGSLTLEVACTANCFRPMVDQKSFVRALQAQGGPAFNEYLKSELAAAIPDPVLAGTLSAQLDAILADPELKGLERFPTIPLSAIGALRPALGALVPAAEPQEDKVITGDLMQLLGGCTPDRSPPAEIDAARMPGVRYGSFPSETLAPCQYAHASTLAQVLTSLAASNGSSVTFKGQTLRTPRELFAALVASGHTIQVRNERMYANFLSLIAADRDVIWPVYLDTGVALSDGKTLSIPMGHSHHAWRISGPQINTRVMFYLGVSGVAFWGQTGSRPAWSGMIASTDVTIDRASGADYDYLLKTLDAASTYLRRIRVERATIAVGKPADGYGYLGVCNDSNATVEHATRGTISTFPLMRAKELDAQPALGDGLDATIRALPKDGDGITDRRDALRRAMAMQPFAADSPMLGWDPALAAQLSRAKADLQ